MCWQRLCFTKAHKGMLFQNMWQTLQLFWSANNLIIFLLFGLWERSLVMAKNLSLVPVRSVNFGQKHTENDAVINSYSCWLHRTPAALEDSELLIGFGRSKLRLLYSHYSLLQAEHLAVCHRIMNSFNLLIRFKLPGRN